MQKLSHLLIRNSDVQKKILRGGRNFPEAIRRKVAVLFIENWFIKNALKRYNRPIITFLENGRRGQLLHGLVDADNRLTFYWFGKKHGPRLTKTFFYKFMPSITWFSLGDRHGTSVVPVCENAFYIWVHEHDTMIDQKSSFKCSIDIHSIAKNGGESQLTRQAGEVVYQKSLKEGYWKC